MPRGPPGGTAIAGASAAPALPALPVQRLPPKLPPIIKRLLRSPGGGVSSLAHRQDESAPMIQTYYSAVLTGRVVLLQLAAGSFLSSGAAHRTAGFRLPDLMTYVIRSQNQDLLYNYW